MRAQVAQPREPTRGCSAREGEEASLLEAEASPRMREPSVTQITCTSSCGQLKTIVLNSPTPTQLDVSRPALDTVAGMAGAGGSPRSSLEKYIPLERENCAPNCWQTWPTVGV